jgi:molybdate transport system permease protein
MAQSFVALPFFVRQAIVSFGAVDEQLIGASHTLGAGTFRSFFGIEVPLARQGLAAGGALAWARALGEFGATALFAGGLQGRTETLPLAIYDEFGAANFTVCLAMSALLVAVSFGVLVTVKVLLRWRET